MATIEQSTAHEISVENPATGEVIRTIPAITPAEVA